MAVVAGCVAQIQPSVLLMGSLPKSNKQIASTVPLLSEHRDRHVTVVPS
jgi:hypothetical protein